MSVEAATTPVASPDEVGLDLRSRPALENEWWYYHGHLAAGEREFGFHLAFFRRRSERVRIGGVVPIFPVSDQVRSAHFALTDIHARKYYYGHQRLLLGRSRTSPEAFDVQVGNWIARGSDETHVLQAEIRGARLELQLSAVKPAVRHGLTGYRTQAGGRRALYFSYPRMDAAGQLTVEGQQVAVQGEAWMDRDYGDFTLSSGLHGWDWFACQFQDGRELMIFQMREPAGRKSSHSLATLIHADGSTERLGAGDFAVEPTRHWTSAATGCTYPVAWRLSLPSFGGELTVRPHLECHEFDSRGSTEVLYWEGPVSVRGQLDGRPADGRGFVELVGYDCHPRRFDTYDFAANSISFAGWLLNEARLRIRGPGVMVREPAG